MMTKSRQHTDDSILLDIPITENELVEDFQGFVQDRMNEPGGQGIVEVFAVMTPATER